MRQRREVLSMANKPSTNRADKLKDIITAATAPAPAAPALPYYRPEEFTDTSTFSTIRQGSATNALTKIKPKIGKNLELDAITGAATIKQGGLALSIPDYSKLVSGGLKTSTYKLLDALTVVFTESGGKSTTVTLSLDEYMKKCGLKDKKEARKQVTADLEALFNMRLSFTGRKKTDQDFLDLRICDAKGIKNGIITFNFSAPFYKVIMGYPVMPYPAQLWKLDAKANPNSYYLLRKIAEHKNMNIGKKNEDIIAVSTLLKVCPSIPSYNDVVKSSNRSTTERIINPFERDLNALADTLTWEYCHSNGQPLTDEELTLFNYEIFNGLLIRTTWRQYPDQTARLETKAERVAAKKKPAPKKKKPDAAAES